MSSRLLTSDALPILRASANPIVGSAVRRDEYPVHVCSSDDVAHEYLMAEIAGRRVALITDDTVAKLHGRRLAGRLAESGIDVCVSAFPPGEANKSMRTAVDLLDWLADTALARRDIVLAVGGGVVIDTVGWVASAYMRGVPYVNVPTTLLGYVDAALGGKVAVDHVTAKNLIGAFYQPKAVVSNVRYLRTLDRRQVRAGLAESIKKGIIASPELFELIERRYDEMLANNLDALEALVRGSSAIKCELIARDPYEKELCRPLNFGHTVGHALETVTGYGPVLHGEAVAFGMAVASRISERRGLVRPAVVDRMVGLLVKIGLPTDLADLPVEVDADAVLAALGQIRKIRDGRIRFVLPVGLGETMITDDVADDEIRSALSNEVGAVR